jgi:F-type H+-transporting ATPase subunit b
MLHVDMNIIWTVVDLLILLVLLRIFLFKPVLGMIEKRKGIIQNSLTDADNANAEAQALKTKYENSLKDAKKESFEIVSEAKDRAQTQYDQIIDKANADATQIVKNATATAMADRERILKDARAELADVALAAAAKLLGTTVDDAANKEMLDKFLAEAGDGK